MIVMNDMNEPKLYLKSIKYLVHDFKIPFLDIEIAI